MISRTFLQIVALTLIAAPLSLARAQQGDKNARPPQAPPGHLEVPNDQFVPVTPTERTTTPAVLQSRDGYVSVQVNVDANGDNISGDAANEPSIAVNPADPRMMVIGWRQFDSILSDFRQAGWGYTADGGHTWTFPGVIEPGVFRSDPVVDADAEGNFYYNSLTATSELTDFWCHVFKSTDGGQSWDDGTYAWGGDKQWQVIDTTDGIGHGNIYACWNLSYSSCSGHFTRSTNGALSFENCTYVSGNPYWGTLTVGPDGELYVSGNGFVVAKSTNAQDPGQSVAWDFSTSVTLGGSMVFSAGPNPAGLLGQCWVDVDRSDGASRGNVYMLCSVDPSGPDPLDVMFARSTDGGQTWSSPVRINDDIGDSAWQWFSTMSVAPNGRIDVIWLDTRNDPGGYDSELYYCFSEDAGVSWSTNEALSPSFNPLIGWPQQQKMGDYFDMTSDDYGADLAYAATFNNEEDIYYLRIGIRCADAGTVILDRPKYACESTANVEVNDCGLNTDPNNVETVQITIDSSSEPAGESVVLTEMDVDTGIFTGSIPLSETDAPGVLLIAESDTVTATYIDADDGEGNYNVTVTDTATVDCTPPLISNVQTIDIEARQATVTFDTDEPARGTVRYGESCGALTEAAYAGGYDTSQSIALSGLDDETTYFYAVDAEDEAGNLATDDNGGTCYSFTTPEVPDYFTELFSTGNDLDNLSLVFTPDGSAEYYFGCTEEIDSLPTDPSGGTPLNISEDSYQQVSLGSGETVSLYGTSYSSFYVCDNGYITFTGSDTDYTESVEDHFDMPRISLLFDDLSVDNDDGFVSWKQEADRAVVTYENVPEYNTSNNNTFQVEMYFNGDIRISYLALDADDGLAGLSDGGGVPSDFYASDLSEMVSCGPRPPTAENDSVTTEVNIAVTVTLIASDDGLPEPPALDYIIVSLPTNGSLSDSGAGIIDSVPYTLVGGGNLVQYDPDADYIGFDSFTFKANDGGTPPEGGDSNVATIDIEVTPPVPHPVYDFPLDTDPGWSVEGQWAFGHPTGGGSHNGDPTSGYTGSNVYGYNLNGDYAAGIPAYYLTTTAIDCSNLTEVELRFWRWLGVESRNFDHATVEVSTDGSAWTVLWENPLTSISDAAWTQMVLDLSAIADGEPTVYLRWSMGPTDPSETYPGWNLDDIEIWATVAECPGDLDGDNDVDLADLAQLLGHYGTTSGAVYEDGDLDGDGDVDLADLAELLSLYGTTCP